MNFLAGAAIVFITASWILPGGKCLPPPLLHLNCVYDVDIAFHQPGVHHRAVRRTGRGISLDTWACETVISLPEDIRDDFPLDMFYQKYTHAYGIPVISSNVSQDEALVRACYTVRFLLADRKDVRDAMFDQYGRVGVIAETERTTQIPEHSHLDSNIYDDRARGLGGIPSIPITTNAEENLMCKSIVYDRWFEEDILIHEFAHAINLISMNWISSTFQSDLTNAYNMAKAENLWQNTYAISKVTEYFAEGVQAFFNVQVCRSFVDNIHNSICTRDALMNYDRRLYDLIVDVFPCMNVVVDRCEANQDLAATNVLRMNCDVLNITTTAVPSTTSDITDGPTATDVTTDTPTIDGPTTTGTFDPRARPTTAADTTPAIKPTEATFQGISTTDTTNAAVTPSTTSKRTTFKDTSTSDTPTMNTLDTVTSTKNTGTISGTTSTDTTFQDTSTSHTTNTMNTLDTVTSAVTTATITSDTSTDTTFQDTSTSDTTTMNTLDTVTSAVTTATITSDTSTDITFQDTSTSDTTTMNTLDTDTTAIYRDITSDISPGTSTTTPEDTTTADGWTTSTDTGDSTPFRSLTTDATATYTTTADTTTKGKVASDDGTPSQAIIIAIVVGVAVPVTTGCVVVAFCLYKQFVMKVKVAANLT